MNVLYSKNIMINGDFSEGYIVIENGKIIDILESFDNDYEDFSNDIIMPGFIDQHIHGWGRGSLFYDNSEDSLRKMVEDMAKEGVTGFLATTTTADLDTIINSIEYSNSVLSDHNKGAKILGLHLEGPFINPEQAGAQNSEYCLKPDIEIFKKFMEACKFKNQIKLTTIAPELDGAKELIEFCHKNNIQVSAGRTNATFDQMMEAKKWGVGGVTHMYGAMKGMHHRELGTVGAALYDTDFYCEFAKQTGITVHHEAFNLAFRIKTSDKIIHTTDCLGNGKQKEPYYHAKRDVHFIPDGDFLIERKSDGSWEKRYDLNDYNSLRNIELSYIDSVRNLLKHTPMSWGDLAKITSTNPAKYIGLGDRGEIKIGNYADFTIISKDVDLVATVVEGERVY